MRIATGERIEELASAKSAAAELGSRGGGKARAARLPADKRKGNTQKGRPAPLAKSIGPFPDRATSTNSIIVRHAARDAINVPAFYLVLWYINNMPPWRNGRRSGLLKPKSGPGRAGSSPPGGTIAFIS
jgi:hypothetical protein